MEQTGGWGSGAQNFPLEVVRIVPVKNHSTVDIKEMFKKHWSCHASVHTQQCQK